MAIHKPGSNGQHIARLGSYLRSAGLTLAAVTLVACGGGGGGVDGGISAAPSVPEAYTPAGLPATITLAWDPNPAQVSGYRIYSGPSADMVTDQILDLPVDGQSINPNAPTVGINAESDLGLRADGQNNVCFAVEAYNDLGTSDPSSTVCAAL